jgi:hypothetical protein
MFPRVATFIENANNINLEPPPREKGRRQEHFIREQHPAFAVCIDHFELLKSEKIEASEPPLESAQRLTGYEITIDAAD